MLPQLREALALDDSVGGVGGDAHLDVHMVAHVSVKGRQPYGLAGRSNRSVQLRLAT